MKLLFLLVALAPHLQAKITIHLDTQATQVGEQVLLEVESDEGPLGSVHMGDVEGLDIQFAGDQSELNWFNGQKSQKYKKRFAITPEKDGEFQIGPIVVEAGGQKLELAPLKLFVKAGETQNQDDDGDAPPFFVKREIPRNRIYVGESLVIKSKTYFRVRATAVEFLQPRESYLQITNLGKSKVQEQIGPYIYEVILTFDHLVPLRAGKFEIPPLEVSSDILVSQKRSRSFFDSFFEAPQRVHRNFKSSPMNIEVLPLPSENANALVGTFKLEAALSRTHLKVGETAELILKIQGNGSLDQLSSWPLKLPGPFKVYEKKTEVKTEVQRQGDALLATRIFAYDLVPTKSGRFDLGPLSLEVFDPSLGAPTHIQSEALSLLVEGAPVADRVFEKSPLLSEKALTPEPVAGGPRLVDIALGILGALILGILLYFIPKKPRTRSPRVSRAKSLKADPTYQSAFREIRTLVAQKHGRKPLAMTPTEVLALLPVAEYRPFLKSLVQCIDRDIDGSKVEPLSQQDLDLALRLIKALEKGAAR